MTPPKAKAKKKAAQAVAAEELQRLVDGAHFNPHAILGAHVTGDHVTVRTLRPDAEAVSVVVGLDKVPLAHEGAGIWAAELKRATVPANRTGGTNGATTFSPNDPTGGWPPLGE